LIDIFTFIDPFVFSARLSLVPLLRPYVWQGPIIPILPSDMTEYLQSPVPYIVGILDLPTALIKELTDVLIVKITKGTDEVILPKKPPVLLPHHDKL
jgi:hypothetical protein